MTQEGRNLEAGRPAAERDSCARRWPWPRRWPLAGDDECRSTSHVAAPPSQLVIAAKQVVIKGPEGLAALHQRGAHKAAVPGGALEDAAALDAAVILAHRLVVLWRKGVGGDGVGSKLAQEGAGRAARACCLLRPRLLCPNPPCLPTRPRALPARPPSSPAAGPPRGRRSAPRRGGRPPPRSAPPPPPPLPRPPDGPHPLPPWAPVAAAAPAAEHRQQARMR